MYDNILIYIVLFDLYRRDRRAEGGVEEPAIAGRRPGEAGDASRRKVIVGAVLHRAVVQRCGRRTNRGVITCRVMRVHFGVTMAEMHHEHSDTPTEGVTSQEQRGERHPPIAAG